MDSQFGTYHIAVVSYGSGYLNGHHTGSVRLMGAHSLLISCPDPILSEWGLGMRLIWVYNQYSIKWLACDFKMLKQAFEWIYIVLDASMHERLTIRPLWFQALQI